MSQRALNCFYVLSLILIWMLEVAVIQEYTLEPRFTRYFAWIGHHLIRWGVTFCTLLFLVSFFRKAIVVVAMLLHVVLSLTLLTYFDYFGTALSEQVILSQFGEGADHAGGALLLVSPTHLALLGAALLIKLFLLSRFRLAEYSPLRKRALILSFSSMLCLFATGIVFLPSLMHPPLWANWKIYARVFGYIPAWTLNSAFQASDEQLLAKAIAGSQPLSDASISDRDIIPFTADHIIILQVESLDYAMMEKKDDKGNWILPNLRALKDSSFLYKLQPSHAFGTATSDFVIITGLTPGGDRLPYKLAGFPFNTEDSLPRRAKKAGFSSSTYHGNYGEFFDRIYPFKQSGFDNVYFMHDFEKAGYPLYFGSIADKDILDYSVRTIGNEKSLHFIITYSSHTPWEHTPFEAVPYPDPPGIYERYANSIFYVDRLLGDYIDRLPENSLVFLFGDHSSGVRYPGNEERMAPGLVYYKGKNLAEFQQTPEFRSGEKAVPFPAFAHLIFTYVDSLPQEAK